MSIEALRRRAKAVGFSLTHSARAPWGGHFRLAKAKKLPLLDGENRHEYFHNVTDVAAHLADAEGRAIRPGAATNSD